MTSSSFGIEKSLQLRRLAGPVHLHSRDHFAAVPKVYHVPTKSALERIIRVGNFLICFLAEEAQPAIAADVGQLLEADRQRDWL